MIIGKIVEDFCFLPRHLRSAVGHVEQIQARRLRPPYATVGFFLTKKSIPRTLCSIIGDFLQSGALSRIESGFRPEFKMDGSTLRSVTGKKNGPASGELPQNMRAFFWDVDPAKLSIAESAHFIIGRLMEHGDEAAVRFLLKNYGRDEMVRVLRKSRSISRCSRVFWSLFLGIDEKSCTPKRYPTPYGNCSDSSIDPWT